MASFGRYQSVRELHRSGFTVVYSGRTAAGTAEEFAIKVLQPSALLLEREQTKTESQLFLDSARTQQKVAARGAQHWAPIYQCGSTPDGAFYATDKYDRSLQQLINGRVKLAANNLHTIIEAVAKGLIELKQVYDRPHGNLKATNVLISDSKIVLSDPLPDQYIDDQVHWDADLRLIAEMIYQLVMHRPSPEVSAWQVPDSKEWATLGRQANDWRNLCNRLLSAHLKPGTMTIEALIEELAQLKKTKPVLSSRWLVAAGLIVVACAVTLIILLRPSIPPEKEDWKKLCTEYLEWVEDLYSNDLGLPKGNKRADQWRKDTDLKEILKKIEAASYPDDVAVATNVTVRDIMDADKAKLKELGADRDKTLRALEAIEYIESFFSVEDPNKAWPLLVNVYDAAKEFEEREWQKPAAAYLNYLVKSVKPPSKEIAKHVNTVLELQDTLNEINSQWGNIEEDKKIIESSGDPILAKFGDYIQLELAPDEGPGTKDDLDALANKLERISSVANELAEFVDDDWKTKVHKEAFFDDHKNDSATAVTKETFNERLDIIKRYYYLRPDPRDNFFKLVSQTKGNIKAAAVPNPQPAGECAKSMAQLQLNIEEIRDFKGIEKYRDEINRKINDLQPKIVDINKIAISLIEIPKDWLQRINEDRSIATSEAVNEKWIVLRGKTLKGHTADELDRNNDLYQILRQRVKDTKENLVKLDQELRRELPSQVNVELREIGWNNKLKQLYDEERKETIKRIVENIPLQNEVPDINVLSFEEFRQTQFSKFKQRQDDLGGILAAFNEIEDRLNACYLLDDGLPQEGETIRSLWEEWKDANILKEPGISDALAKLTARIQKLIEIEQSGDRQELVKIADTAVQTEAAYAAWVRLGELPDPRWPSEDKDRQSDKRIQDRLKVEFETIKRQNQIRGDLLLKILADAGLEREIVFRKANIKRDKTTITKNSSQDKILIAFEALRPTGDNLNDINDLETLARDLAVFVTDPNWPTKFRPDIFADESPLYEKATLTKSDFENWLQEVKNYRKLDDDPRDKYTWDAKIDKIKSSINNELAREPSGEYLAKLESLKSDFNDIEPKIKKMLSLDAIERHKEEIYKSRDYWNDILDIENRLKPPICERLELLKNGQLAFGAKFLDPNLFEPVDAVDKKPVRLLTGWQEIRQGINKKQKEWLDFFYTIDVNDTKNVGWPEYVRSKTETNPSVILRFIPADPPVNPEPFYMATHEITNDQYQMFLKKTGATSFAGNEDKWSWFKSKTGRDLILCTSSDNPSCGVIWEANEQTFVLGQWDDEGKGILRDKAEPDFPVTYVTYYGAESYATRLGGRLPTASQHKYACKAGTNNIYPWGNRDDLAQIPYYAHVRGEPWRGGKDEYNSKIGTLDIPPLPVGAVKPKDFEAYQTPLSDANTVHEEATYGAGSSWLPIEHANRPNAWGLYDMIGNVWEWCIDDVDNTQSVICGGSCLAPPKYILLESESDYTVSFNEQASDVGFRVIVPAR